MEVENSSPRAGMWPNPLAMSLEAQGELDASVLEAAVAIDPSVLARGPWVALSAVVRTSAVLAVMMTRTLGRMAMA